MKKLISIAAIIFAVLMIIPSNASDEAAAKEDNRSVIVACIRAFQSENFKELTETIVSVLNSTDEDNENEAIPAQPVTDEVVLK